MKPKPVQRFSEERLMQDQLLPKEEIVRFLEDFQVLQGGDEGQRQLIRLRVPERLLNHFKLQSKQRQISYQTQIVRLMREWLKSQSY